MAYRWQVSSEKHSGLSSYWSAHLTIGIASKDIIHNENGQSKNHVCELQFIVGNDSSVLWNYKIF